MTAEQIKDAFENLVSYERYKAKHKEENEKKLFENLVSYERYKAVYCCTAHCK